MSGLLRHLPLQCRAQVTVWMIELRPILEFNLIPTLHINSGCFRYLERCSKTQGACTQSKARQKQKPNKQYQSRHSAQNEGINDQPPNIRLQRFRIRMIRMATLTTGTVHALYWIRAQHVNPQKDPGPRNQPGYTDILDACRL